MKPLIIAGTDTDVGKTTVSAMLTLALGAVYWKPVQSGTEGGTDRARVAMLTGLPAERFRPETYVLRAPLSPHRAAELDGVRIDPGRLALPDVPNGSYLIVETAGGVLVPLTREDLQIDQIGRWAAPVVLCARTTLGTINHSLLTLEALYARKIDVLGIVFVGEEMEDTERTIVEMGRVKRLGRLPMLPRLDADALRTAFAAQFTRADFEAAHG